MSHSCLNLVSTSFLYNPYIPFFNLQNFFIYYIYIYGRRKIFSPFTVRTTGRVIPFCFHSVSVPFLFNFRAVAVLVRFQTVPVFVPRAAVHSGERPGWRN